MKDIEDIIKKDTKLLLRHLKEKHVLMQYRLKNINGFFMTYKKWLECNISKKNIYLEFLPSDAFNDLSYVELLKINDNLIFHSDIFSAWGHEPRLLENLHVQDEYNYNNDEEMSAWYYIDKTFLEFKKLFFEINEI